MLSKLNIFHLIYILLIGVACQTPVAPKVEKDYSDILKNIGNNIIINTYDELATKATTLHDKALELKNNPSEAKLDNVRQAWIDARAPWEQSEGFLFGPVSQEGLDPAIDSWPVNITDLNNVLSNTTPLNAKYLGQQEGTLKGFHTIEFLLWGENSNKSIDEFTTREYEYLEACTNLLRLDTKKLYDAWSPSGENFIINIVNAGKGSKLYVSQKSALEEISQALGIIADEVGNGKINSPLANNDISLVESRFSANSKNDFADNIRSMKHIYTGINNNIGNGQSISSIVQQQDDALDKNIKESIDKAINSITDIPISFSDAIINNKPAIQKAQNAVRNLEDIIASKLLPLIENL